MEEKLMKPFSENITVELRFIMFH